HIRDGDRDGRQGGVLVAGGLDGVQHLSGHGEAVLVDGAVYDLAQLLLAAGEGHLI
ncbi:Virus attachment protein p12 family, partial [Dysosmobacter welbionis]